MVTLFLSPQPTTGPVYLVKGHHMHKYYVCRSRRRLSRLTGRGYSVPTTLWGYSWSCKRQTYTSKTNWGSVHSKSYPQTWGHLCLPIGGNRELAGHVIYCDVTHSIHTPRDSFRGALRELVRPFYNELPKVRLSNVM